MADNYLEKRYEEYERRKRALQQKSGSRRGNTIVRNKKEEFYWES